MRVVRADPASKNSPLTTSANGLQVVERKGVEPTTSALQYRATRFEGPVIVSKDTGVGLKLSQQWFSNWTARILDDELTDYELTRKTSAPCQVLRRPPPDGGRERMIRSSDANILVCPASNRPTR
jgi:hypothetical protein